MTTYRSTYVPPPPRVWPIPVGFIIALLLVGGAMFFSLPALYLLAYLPTVWFATQLARCFLWGCRWGDIEGAFR